MKTTILEACADCVQSAINAQKGGADRIELCSNLVIGGLTPGKALFDLVKKYTDIKTRVLLRPRYGDYCYNQYEFEQLKEEVQMYCEMGADGVVIGMLNPERIEFSHDCFFLFDRRKATDIMPAFQKRKCFLNSQGIRQVGEK